MKRLTVWAYAEDADVLAKRLVRQKCVDVDLIPQDEIGELVRCDPSARIRELEIKLADIESAIQPLYKYDTRKKSLIPPPAIEVDREAIATNVGGLRSDTETVVKRINDAVARMNETERELNDARADIAAATPWLGCGIPLDLAETPHTRVLMGSISASIDDAALDARLDGLAVAWRRLATEGNSSYVIFIVENSDADELQRRLGSAGFTRAVFKNGCGSAEDICASAKKRICALEAEGTELDELLRTLSCRIDDIKVLWDTISTEMINEKVKERLLASNQCVLLLGWIPEKKTDKVTSVLESIECAYSLTDPAKGDDVPVKLENNRFAACFEWVVGMYSLPAYGSFDPTFVMSFFYILFFAMMFADVGYGLLLVLGGFLAPKLMHMKPKKAQPFYMFGYCGIGCIITGVLFGGYFGDMPLAIIKALNPDAVLPDTLALVVDPIADPMTFMILGLVLGFIHLVAGQVIKFVLVWKTSPLDAICDYGLFWVLYAGLILLLFAPSVGKWVAIGALIAIVLTGGRKEKNIFMKLPKGLLALYGLVNFGSDILSYSRILALALSGGVLAQVMNILGTIGGSSPAAVIIGMLLCFVIGHMLNLALSALGAFVHTSRLQYIEFFGKFYEDGGRPFSPLEPSERYSEDIAEKATTKI